MKIQIILVLIFLFPIVYGLECQRVMAKDDMPCTIYSSWRPDDGCNYTVDFFLENGTMMFNTTWTNSTPFCNLTANLTAPGTYQYSSTIEDGLITIEQTDNMITIIFLQLFLITFFVIIGIPHKAGFFKLLSWGLAGIELLITVWMVYINEINGSIIELLYINSISVLIVGGALGFITLLMVMVKLMNAEKNNSIANDGYTKWMYK